MRRLALTAAGLLLVGVSITTAGRAAQTPAATHHTCSATDRQFINVAHTAVMSVMIAGEDFVRGDVTGDEAVAAAKASARRVVATAPTDPTLKQSRTLLHGMFTEYGKAIRSQMRGLDAGSHMFRAYSLANYAHQELAKAEPDLRRLGCEVSALL